MVDSVPAPQGGALLPPDKEDIEAKFDLGIALALSEWEALTAAVSDHLGGSNSEEKRDWFAGAISDLFARAKGEMDVDYLEHFMWNVMWDEFEFNAEESGEEVAAKIVGLRKLTLQGDFRLVNEMMDAWKDRQKKGGNKSRIQYANHGESDDDTDSGSDSIEDGDDGGDVTMSEAPQTAPAPRVKPPPDIDEDGFTKYVSKKKR